MLISFMHIDLNGSLKKSLKYKEIIVFENLCKKKNIM